MIKKIFLNEKSYKFYKRFLILLIFISIFGIMGFIMTFTYLGSIHHYMGKYYEPEDRFKSLKEYENYKTVSTSSLYIGPSEWINYCGYNIKKELKNGILINSEDELKELYNKILKESPFEYKLEGYSSFWYDPEFYYALDDLVKKITIDDFYQNSLIVLTYDNMTNVCGLKVTDVNLSNDKATIDIAVSEGKTISSETGSLGDSINSNAMILVIKTEKITQAAEIEINIEKYDCYILEKEMESYIY